MVNVNGSVTTNFLYKIRLISLESMIRFFHGKMEYDKKFRQNDLKIFSKLILDIFMYRTVV